MSRHRSTRSALVAALAAVLAAATLGITPASSSEPADDDPPAAAGARSVTTGSGHTCALLFDGSVKCWGRNHLGQLGLGDTEDRGDEPGEMGHALPTVDLGAGRTARALSAGADHTCAILDDGSLRCWGSNGSGRLGIGTSGTDTRGDETGEMGDALPPVDLGTGRRALAVGTGSASTCALLDTHQVKCWGTNTAGELGQGHLRAVGSHPSHMGDHLPAVDLGTDRSAVGLSVGMHHACALLDDATVKCWGNNGWGALGVGHPWPRGGVPEQMGDGLLRVDLGTDRAAVALGHGCALLDDATLKCWGPNFSGQLGQGDTAHRGDTHGSMGDALPPIALGSGRTPVTVFSDGRTDSPCALLDDSTLRCWGDNRRGQLGLGDTQNRGDAPGTMGDALPPVDLGTGRRAVDVAPGDDHTCARLDDATVRCWGGNDAGQLGLGDTDDRGDEAGEMGDALAAVDLADPPAPALEAVLEADREVAFTGEPIGYHLTITNTGNAHLTNTAVSVPGAPDCDLLLGTFSVGAEADLACTHTAVPADAGTYTTIATVTSDQTGPVASNPVDVTVVRDRRPDTTIKRAGGPRVGDGLYGADPTDPAQTVAAGRKRGGRVTFVVGARNGGDARARYSIRRLGSTPGLTVRYFDRGTDVTRSVVNRTYRTPVVAPGARHTLRVEVAVNHNALRRVPHDITLRAVSDTGRPQQDTVRATVNVN